MISKQEKVDEAFDDMIHPLCVLGVHGNEAEKQLAERIAGLIVAHNRGEAPPAAAHGDEAVLDVLKTAYESGYQDGQDAPNAYSDEKVKHRIALSLLEEMMADAAMRAQAGEGGEV